MENSTTTEITQPIKPRNNKKKIILISSICLVVFFSLLFIWIKFNKKEPFCLKDETQIYDYYKKSVVLVKNTYTYEISINGSEPFSIDPKLLLSQNKSSFFEDFKKEITGTGFFVSEEGHIVTNHHVVEPWFFKKADEEHENEDEEYYDPEIANIKSLIIENICPTTDPKKYKEVLENSLKDGVSQINLIDDEEAINQLYKMNTENGKTLENKEAYVSTTLDTSSMENDTSNVNNSEEFETEEYNEIRNEGDEIYEKKIALQNSKIYYFNEYEDKIEFASEAIKITCKLIDTSIALHGSNSDWLKCKVIKLAEGTDIDLALLQLEIETLPEEVENIVDLENAVKSDSNIKPGSEAILIGYPLGMELAKSKKGDLKVQIYDGKISKESDGIKLQYSTTSTHGASGSPIFNSCGQLIAVNYSGYDFTQGYNFGIVSKHIHSLLN